MQKKLKEIYDNDRKVSPFLTGDFRKATALKKENKMKMTKLFFQGTNISWYLLHEDEFSTYNENNTVVFKNIIFGGFNASEV